jgi:predicted RNA-binding Zn-ribbon protein involved in translation (DUF1610 family)
VIFGGGSIEPRFICPRCGKKQRYIRAQFLFLRGLLTYEEFTKIYGGSKPDEFSYFFCPSCGALLRKVEIQRGFFRWLRRLKKESPRRYAKAIAELL